MDGKCSKSYYLKKIINYLERLACSNVESSYYTQCLKDIQHKEKIVSEENNGDIL